MHGDEANWAQVAHESDFDLQPVAEEPSPARVISRRSSQPDTWQNSVLSLRLILSTRGRTHPPSNCRSIQCKAQNLEHPSQDQKMEAGVPHAQKIAMPTKIRFWDLGRFPTHWYLVHERTRMDAVIDASTSGLSTTSNPLRVITTVFAYTIALSVDNVDVGNYGLNCKAEVLAPG